MKLMLLFFFIIILWKMDVYILSVIYGLIQ